MNTSTIYDRNLYKNKFKEIYNSNYYDFPINNNMLSNIITKWKNSTYKFKKECAQYNLYDYQNRLLLRDYRSIFLELPNKKNATLLEYIIWGNNENISRMRISENIFIDGTFHQPPKYKQLIIIIFKDLLTTLKIPGLFILINGKHEKIL